MMIFYQPLLPAITHLDADESKHCVKVLRKKQGDEINIVDGKGKFYKAKIRQAHHKKCEFEVLETKTDSQSSFYRHLAIAPTKNMDRMEWLVEKATEIGVDEISFFQSFHSERKVLKIERLERKVISAMKQSLKAHKPKLRELISFQELIQNDTSEEKYLAYVDFENTQYFKDVISKNQSTTIMIGPEGDFSEDEVELAKNAKYQLVSLGDSRLRTETAGMVAVHLMNL